MSLGNLLGVARAALLAHRRAMDVTAHNIANAQTPGYRRQRLDLVVADPWHSGLGPIGRGVVEGGITRASDRLADASFRRESSLLGRSGMMRDLLDQVEAAMGEPSDLGIAAALDGLLQSFGDLANEPTSAVHRDLVRHAAIQLTSRFHQLDQRITETSNETVGRIRDAVGEVNDIARQVADLNAAIVAAQGDAPDLEDQRDLLLDRLSDLTSVRVLERSDGSVGVIAGNVLLVDGTNIDALSVSVTPGGVTIQSPGPAFDAGSGRIAGLMSVANVSLPRVRADLDAFAQSLVAEINSLHGTGTTLDGVTDIDFFDPSGLTAGTISLSAAVAASGNAIAAGTGAAGDGSIALRIAAVGDIPLAGLGGRAPRDFYAALAASVGLEVNRAADDVTVQQTLVGRAEALRSSVTGVSVDEEMAILIVQQQAYAAAARLVSVAEEMIDELLRIV